MLPCKSLYPPHHHHQLPGKTTLLVAILFSMLLLLLTTGSNYLLEGTFGVPDAGIARQPPAFNFSAPPAPSSNSKIQASPKETEARSSSKETEARSSAKETEAPSSSKRTEARSSAKETEARSKDPAPQDWIRLPPVANYTEKFLALLADNGTKACHHFTTTRAQLYGLPAPRKGYAYSRLPCGEVHEVTLVSYDETGRRRCHGGDYFETELSGGQPVWKSRPPIKDLGDGSYSVLLQVHPFFAGLYTLRIILLFSNFHGLHRRPEQWSRDEVVVNLQIEFERRNGLSMVTGLSHLRQCRREDFGLDAWAGRWTQARHHKKNCSVDGQGRFRCLKKGQECDKPWCRGPIGVLESNGFVYSAHCSFQLFNEDAAWKCLDKKWIFFWGDSNHVDTIRNLLNFVLGFEDITEVPRRFDATYIRPSHGNQSVRITSLFNGHSNVSLNQQGLKSLSDPAFRELIRSYFTGDSAPDVVIMNSGLHDGMYWKHVHQFVEDGVKEAIKLWLSILSQVKGKKPRMVYRNTIATAAWARSSAYNPHKMEVFNHMFVDQLRRADLIWGVIDGFDLTYPWHYDNNCSDGVHYGKPPAAKLWYGQIGHQYFVDLMLVHVLLNAICSH